MDNWQAFEFETVPRNDCSISILTGIHSTDETQPGRKGCPELLYWLSVWVLSCLRCASQSGKGVGGGGGGGGYIGGYSPI